MHLQPCFKGCKYYGTGVGDRYFASGICLPSGMGLTVAQQNRVIKAVKSLVK
jgi:dTDP-4-amino-4,6-dideoxygalactose transaminase